MPTKLSRVKRIRIPEKKMVQHFLSVGDTGAGKTTLNKQLIHDAIRKGESCIINDSKDGEFTQEFYRPERGDVILNPKDMRCPYWLLADEFSDEAEALEVMRAFFPSHPNNPQAQFWDDYANRLTAFLVANVKPSLDCASLARILISEDAIAACVKGTEFGQLFDVDGGGSSNMRTSVIQTVNQIGYALRMMPSRDQAETTFSIADWSRNRTGWIFLSNAEMTAEAIIPLQSAWIGMIINRLLADGNHPRRVRIILDELDTLNQIPKLQRAMTKLRSSGNIMSLGIQNTAQLEDRYGKQADTIFSQAGTKLVLRTSDDRSARRLQDLIGENEIRQVRQSRTAGIFGGRERDSYSGPEEIRKPCILASQIQGLPDLQGYLLQAPTDEEVGLHVLHIKLPYFPLVSRQPGLIPRTITRQDTSEIAVRPEPEAPPAAERTATLVRLS